MKIDKVTYEVDLSDGDKRPIYVWEAPVRVWHWLMVITMFTMIVTGYLIGRPLEANLGNTWATFQFADIRMIHFIAGICLPYFLGVHGQPLRSSDLPAAFLVL